MKTLEKFLTTKTAIFIGIVILSIILIFLLGYKKEFITVRLYYPNTILANRLGTGGECDPRNITYVERSIELTKTPIQDTVRLLIRGQLTDKEKANGFNTEFPNKNFKLLGADLSDGSLTLFFNDVPGFTVGGSCRVGLLSSSIEKTAIQFGSVREVKFSPESLFQP